MSPDLEFLYQAMANTYGISIMCDDAKASRQRLYQARAKSGDPTLDELQIRIAPTFHNRVWIIKKQPSEALSRSPKEEDLVSVSEKKE